MGYRPALSLLLSATLGLASCGTIDRRIDPDAPDPVGGTGLQSQDIRSMADQMARDIIQSGILVSNDRDQRIAFHITSLRNDSNTPIDREIILTKIRTELFRGLGRRVQILDRSAEGFEAVRSEVQAKRDGAVTSNPNLRGQIAGSDYALKGTIKDRVATGRSLRSAYYLVTFELIDLETTELVWTNDYETKFESERSVIYR